MNINNCKSNKSHEADNISQLKNEHSASLYEQILKPERKSKTPIKEAKKSITPNKTIVQLSKEKTRTESFSSSMLLIKGKNDIDKYSQLRNLMIISMLYQKFRLLSKFKTIYYINKWKQIKNDDIKKTLNEEFYEMNLVLNERLFRENEFRSKIKLQKSELESKISILQQLVSNLTTKHN